MLISVQVRRYWLISILGTDSVILTRGWHVNQHATTRTHIIYPVCFLPWEMKLLINRLPDDYRIRAETRRAWRLLHPGHSKAGYSILFRAGSTLSQTDSGNIRWMPALNLPLGIQRWKRHSPSRCSPSSAGDRLPVTANGDEGKGKGGLIPDMWLLRSGQVT